jgi:penicillin amidase
MPATAAFKTPCPFMKYLRLSISALITLLLIFFLNRNLTIGPVSIPPLGKFLDPFHGFWQNSYDDKLSDELDIEGLKNKVSIYTDSVGMVHIFASNEDDLFLAQGYITARHRLWQMEFQTMAAAGRLSEIIGSAALDYDRGQRRAGMMFGALNNLKELEQDSMLLLPLTHYTEGVNQYIESLSYEDLPFEYKLLGYEPESWDNLKGALVEMNLSQTLNTGEKDLQMTNALKLFGKETLDVLYPDREEVGAPIVDNPGKWMFKPITLDTVPLALPDALIQIKAPAGKPDGIGSNNWVVSGKKTATGSPILCNDPHLNLTMPSLWFVVHLNAPTINVMGASLAGGPSVILGFNDSIAWGCTNADRDLVDWYRIKFKDRTKNEYWSDGQWVKSRKVVEQFRIKNGSTFYDTVTYTHHGPVRFDENFHGDNEHNLFAYRWLSHDAANPFKTFYLLNKARNYTDYVNALNYYAAPAQNFVFGSVSGDIAIRVQGKFPIRRPGEGKFVLDGTKTNQEWQAFIPYDQNVGIKNPISSYLFSANQYPVDATYPYYIQAGSNYEAYRNRRISQTLAAATNVTPADMMKLQNDNFNLKAAESLPFMINQLDSFKLTPNERILIDELRQWNFINSAESTASVYYAIWWAILYRSLWDEMESQTVSMSLPSDFTTIKLMKEKPNFHLFDSQETPERDSLKMLILKSFRSAMERVEQWKENRQRKTLDWASYKDTQVQHLLRLEPLSYHVRNGGNGSAINATTRSAGPSWRMVVSLEKTGVKAWGVYPGGQSGNPGSKFYGNFIEEWTDGEYFPLQFSSSPDAYSKNHTRTTLNPSR